MSSRWNQVDFGILQIHMLLEHSFDRSSRLPHIPLITVHIIRFCDVITERNDTLMITQIMQTHNMCQCLSESTEYELEKDQLPKIPILLW